MHGSQGKLQQARCLLQSELLQRNPPNQVLLSFVEQLHASLHVVNEDHHVVEALNALGYRARLEAWRDASIDFFGFIEDTGNKVQAGFIGELIVGGSAADLLGVYRCDAFICSVRLCSTSSGSVSAVLAESGAAVAQTTGNITRAALIAHLQQHQPPRYIPQRVSGAVSGLQHVCRAEPETQPVARRIPGSTHLRP